MNNPFSNNRVRICRTCTTCSATVFEKIRISSMKMNTKWLRTSRSTSLMRPWNTAWALVRPNYITKYKVSWRSVDSSLPLVPSQISNKYQAFFRSTLVNTQLPEGAHEQKKIKGGGYLFLTYHVETSIVNESLVLLHEEETRSKRWGWWADYTCSQRIWAISLHGLSQNERDWTTDLWEGGRWVKDQQCSHMRYVGAECVPFPCWTPPLKHGTFEAQWRGQGSLTSDVANQSTC